MSVFNNNLLLGAAGQAGGAAFDTTLIPNSVWLDGSADTLTKTFSSGSPQTKIVISTWIQRNSFGTAQDIFCAQGGTGGASRQNRIHFESDDTIDIGIETTTIKTIIYSTTKVFRDIGWYHILLSIDQGQSVGPAQVNLFVNGVAVTIAATVLDQGFTAALSSWGNSSALHSVGSNGGSVRFFNGYQAQTTMLVGQSIQSGDVAVTDFLDSFTYGTNGSQFVPKANADVAALASTAGGNSFCLDFANSSDLGNDISSNNNDFSLTSMAAVNQSTNTPSLVFPVLNAIDSDPALAANLKFGNRLGDGVSDWDSIFSTLPMGKTGKWYFEVRVHTEAAGNGFVAGIHDTTTTSRNYANYIGNSTATFGLGYALYTVGSTYSNNVEIHKSITTLAAGDVVMMAVDLDNNKIWWGENGTFYLSGNPATGANPMYTLEADTEYVFGMSPSSQEDYFVNFGADSTFGGAVSAGNNADENGIGDFKHAPPSGYLCLCSANLTAPEFQGADFFNTNLYTGNGTAIGSGGKAVTGVGFKPDWSWIKNRDAADSHSLYDLVRGTTKQLESDNGAAETTEAESLTTFGTDGFTVGSLAQVNTNTEDYVSWNWLGSNSTSTTSPAGSLASTSTVASAGHFSVVSYTGTGSATTIGHGLGAKPDLIIIKGRGNAINWPIYSTPTTATKVFYLDLTNDAAASGAGSWNNTEPTASVFSVGNASDANASSVAFIAYCFKSIAGVCKVGTYTGNGSTNGPYISTGFKPRWIIYRVLDSGTNAFSWTIVDTARSPINGPNSLVLHPNLTSAGSSGSGNTIDILSDGFKRRDSHASVNQSGKEYIYMAMADIGGNGTLPPIYAR